MKTDDFTALINHFNVVLSNIFPFKRKYAVPAFVINLPMKVQIRLNIWFAARFSSPKAKLI